MAWYLVAGLGAAAAVLLWLWRREARLRKAAEVRAESNAIRADTAAEALASYRAAEIAADTAHAAADAEEAEATDHIADLRRKLKDIGEGTGGEADERADRLDGLFGND